MLTNLRNTTQNKSLLVTNGTWTPPPLSNSTSDLSCSLNYFGQVEEWLQHQTWKAWDHWHVCGWHVGQSWKREPSSVALTEVSSSFSILNAFQGVFLIWSECLTMQGVIWSTSPANIIKCWQLALLQMRNIFKFGSVIWTILTFQQHIYHIQSNIQHFNICSFKETSGHFPGVFVWQKQVF